METFEYSKLRTKGRAAKSVLNKRFVKTMLFETACLMVLCIIAATVLTWLFGGDDALTLSFNAIVQKITISLDHLLALNIVALLVQWYEMIIIVSLMLFAVGCRIIYSRSS